jgi:hypothetical protein
LAYSWKRQAASSVLAMRRKADPKNLIHLRYLPAFRILAKLCEAARLADKPERRFPCSTQELGY